MTVSSTSSRADLTGPGVSYPFTFKVFATTDVKVYVNGALKTIVTDYTVALSGSPPGSTGGTVTLNVDPGAVPVSIVRAVAYTQLIDFPVAGKFPADTAEEGYDRSTVLIQQLLEAQGRSLVLPESSPLTPTLPAPIVGLELFRWNAAKTDLELVSVPDTILTTLGDLLVGTGASPATKRVGIGSANQLVGVVSGDIGYVDHGAIPAEFKLTGTISPSQITADQNDYAPTGFATATALRIDLDAAHAITGIAGGVGGRTIIIHNISAFALTLKNESASSAAANRFAVGDDVEVVASSTVMLRYDATSSRWRLAAGSGSGGAGVAFTYFMS